MGASNSVMWNSYGVNCLPDETINNSIPHPSDLKRKRFFLPDVPHLFKNIKQALLNT